ncbi:MAG: diphosphomevalonate decarboxylase [Capnocytophaga sp.]|nr:diphosphomevalonate decarboxylase [Capnocytophaga sp.]
MNHSDFIVKKYTHKETDGTVNWQSPSNIALVKYWGKFAGQIPANPSVSFTLKNCHTTTEVVYSLLDTPADDFQFDFFFEGEPKPSFHPKIETFFERILSFMPFLKDYRFEIYSSNSFPHSSGIASSASSMAALSMCLMLIEKKLYPKMNDHFFWNKASFLARMGSGSACRSVRGGIVVWGQHLLIDGSSNFYGIPYPLSVDPVFQTFQDTVLLIDKGEKQVSSSEGHNLMYSNPYAEKRFSQAHDNITQLMQAFSEGDLNNFIKIVESEALTLHAMMMTSQPYFILIKPQTLEVIQRIWEYRKRTSVPVCFTLDAGANVHVLYPQQYQHEVLQFIKNELVVYCQNKQYICDEISENDNPVL